MHEQVEVEDQLRMLSFLFTGPNCHFTLDSSYHTSIDELDLIACG